MKKQDRNGNHPYHDEVGGPNHLEPGQLKPKDEGINNTDLPGVPPNRRALNNPTGQNEGLANPIPDPLAEVT